VHWVTAVLESDNDTPDTRGESINIPSSRCRPGLCPDRACLVLGDGPPEGDNWMCEISDYSIWEVMGF
jgi:hypothetical protein